ncbi:MAG: peroxisomal targeting signal 2 receptor [Trizodia sp. TS-e1964]|nr:MAG: peroxisomal targeting signal 2 receptor [Trizodia sp. TS-e1964]
MLEFRTPGFNGYSVKYSPFIDSRLAVASAANYGLVGNGRLYILGLTPSGILAEKYFDTQDSLFDLSWSETHENQLVAACGDGSLKLFDTTLDTFPVQSFHEHTREVFAVHWNLVAKDVFASSSWDGTIKIWNPARPISTRTLTTGSCTYSTAWSPHTPLVLSAVTSDSHLRLYDLRAPSPLVLALPLHTAPQPPSEALTHDWNKYREGVVAAAGVDRVVRVADTRGRGVVTEMPGHEYAVRRVAWSPHLSDVLLSVSYDMSCRVWSDGGGDSSAGLGPRLLGSMLRHTEFATGVDWCLFGDEGWVATCGWDERVLVWDVRSVMGGKRG